MNLGSTFRGSLRWLHLWMGLLVGLFICLMGVTGTLVTFRPQIANALSAPAVSPNGCTEATDWNQAEKQIEAYMGGAKIDRLYFPGDSDPRVQIRIQGDSPKIYKHVTFDGCAGKVLGTINYGWMYWLVDLHHNLLAENAGRRWAGAIGVVLLLSSVGGLLLWFLSKPNLFTAFRVQTKTAWRASMDLHRAFGLAAMPLLILPAFTGIWVSYSQPLRSALSSFVTVVPDTRPARARNAGPVQPAPLGDIIVAARQALPDGQIREIRVSENGGSAQVRMWRSGDFRSLGNNVVFVDGSTAKVLAIDLYDGKPSGNRFIQAMAGIHYAEWGGLPFRTIYGVAALTTVLLFVTGVLIWWLPKRRRVASPVRTKPELSPQGAAFGD